MSDSGASLRERARLRAQGCCEYCGISEQLTLAEHEIDHVIALKHGGQTVIENLALCCAVCNRFKGSDIASLDPDAGTLTPLFNPRFDLWHDHYHLQNGEVVPLTAKARATVRLLQMNRPARIRERRIGTFR